MRIRDKSCLVAAVFLGGCILEPISEYGEKCPPDGASGNVSGGYLDGTGFCQKDHLCIPVGTTDDFICTTQCGTDSSNKPEDAAICANKCIESFHDLNIAICELDDDIPLCAKGYADCDRRIATGCEANLSSMQHCGACDSECSENAVPNSRTVECKNSKCRAKDCQNHYHLMADGSCAEDTNDACTDLETGEVIDCQNANHAVDGECQSGKCRIIACKPGFHLSGEGAGNLCIENTDFECGNELVNCVDLPHVLSASCSVQQGECEVEVCESGYHPANHSCEIDSVEACGATLARCESPANGAAHCFDGFCDFTCNNGYHRNEDLCEEDSIFNCGDHDNACSTEQIKNSKEVACKEGVCVATECNAGCHLYNGTCEANSYANCGKHDSKCPNELCQDSLIINSYEDNPESVNYTNNDVFCVSGMVTVGPKIQTLTMKNLIYAGGFSIKYDAASPGEIRKLTLSKLVMLADKAPYINGTNSSNVWNCSMVIINAHKLKTLSLPKLQIASGALFISNNNGISSVSLPVLKSSKSIVFTRLNSLTSVDAPKLEKHTNSFYLTDDPLLETFELPVLTQAYSLVIRGNQILKALNFNYAAINKLEIYNNPQLSCSNICSLKNYSELNSHGITNNAEESCDLKATCP